MWVVWAGKQNNSIQFSSQYVRKSKLKCELCPSTISRRFSLLYGWMLRIIVAKTSKACFKTSGSEFRIRYFFTWVLNFEARCGCRSKSQLTQFLPNVACTIPSRCWMIFVAIPLTILTLKGKPHLSISSIFFTRIFPSAAPKFWFFFFFNSLLAHRIDLWRAHGPSP